MKKGNLETVQQVAAMSEQMNTLTVDRINEIAPPAKEILPPPMSLKERAKLEGVPYIEPNQKMPSFGKLPDEWKKHRDHDWEYVMGIFQSGNSTSISPGEPQRFWLCVWPGDPDCEWVVPIGVKCYVPRMVATLLSGEKHEHTGMEAMKYHKFGYPDPEGVTAVHGGELNTNFRPRETIYTGRFLPVGAF